MLRVPFEVCLMCCPTRRGVVRAGGRVRRRNVDDGPASVKLIIEQTARDGPCPACGVLPSTVKDRPQVRIKDLPASGQQVELWWRKRRLVCAEALCPRQSFTQTSHGGAAPSAGDRAAAGQARLGDRVEQPAGRRRRRRVRRVVADRAQGADRRGGPLAAGAGADDAAGDR